MRKAVRLLCATGAADISPTELKNHCHNVINTLGPLTPPEAFLFRGNAYYELGFPYFALADYNTAGSVLQLSGAHQNKCMRALEKFPDLQVGEYPSSDTHLHIYVKPMLGEGVALQKINDTVGRGVVAQTFLEKGSTVVKASEPWLRYPVQENSCAYCALPLPDRTFPCGNPDCHEEYCSRDCRALALGAYHKTVCTNKDFQNIELDIYAQLASAQKEGNLTERNAAAAQLLMLRVISSALIMQVVPSAMAELRTLYGRLVFTPLTLSTTTLHLYERIARSLRVLTVISYEEMIGILARITANCFYREDAIELHHARSMLNHSCEANVAEDASTGALVTARDVEKGEELCINYYPQLKRLPYQERKAELERRGFECSCSRCLRKE